MGAYEDAAKISFGCSDLVDTLAWSWSATTGNRIAPGLFPDGVPDMDYSASPAEPTVAQE